MYTRPFGQFRDSEDFQGSIPLKKSKCLKNSNVKALFWTKLLKNALKILNINNKNITFQLVENKYKKLVKKYHPDKNKGDKKYEEKLKKINQAFEEIKEQLVTKLN